jgi:hypothetical protein
MAELKVQGIRKASMRWRQSHFNTTPCLQPLFPDEDAGQHARRRGVTRCVQAATPQRTPADKRKLQTVQH